MDINVQPMIVELSEAFDIKSGDVIYIFQHPNCADEASMSSSQCKVAGEYCACVSFCSYTCICVCVYVYTYALTLNVQFLNTDIYLYYSSATECGSSGSPIVKEVNGKLRVVGLHRAGDEEHNWSSLFSEIINHMQGKDLKSSKLKEQNYE